MGLFSGKPEDPAPKSLFKPHKRKDESEEEFNKRLADWKAGEVPLADFKERYENPSHDEREDCEEHVGNQ